MIVGALSGYGKVMSDVYSLGTLTPTATMLKQMDALLTGSGTVTAGILGRINLVCTIKVNALTQSDVEGAVLESAIDGGMTVRQVMKALLAIMAGKTNIATGPPVVVTFRNPADTKDRVTAEMDGSERVDVTFDMTD